MSSAEIQILAEPEDNGAQYRCEAHNAAAASPVSVSTTLVVFFPPETVKVRIAEMRRNFEWIGLGDVRLYILGLTIKCVSLFTYLII